MQYRIASQIMFISINVAIQILCAVKILQFSVKI